jgi:hypothetical protein
MLWSVIFLTLPQLLSRLAAQGIVLPPQSDGWRRSNVNSTGGSTRVAAMAESRVDFTRVMRRAVSQGKTSPCIHVRTLAATVVDKQ